MALLKIVGVLAIAVLSAVSGLKTTQEVEAYLCKYGYLIENCHNNQLASEENRIYAIKWWQMFSNLEVTGFIGPEDENVMNRRRCACEDVMQKDEVMNPELQPQQFNLGPKWTKTTLTWKLTKPSNQLDVGKTRREIGRALRHWSNETPLRFTEVSGDSDITISFEVRNHGDGAANSFDGRGRVLAHAYFPSSGDVHFDEEESWGFGDEVGNTKTDFFTVAVHEFGHTLGLFHSDVYGALMYPYYSGYNASFRLHTDDVRGIQSLYGPPPGMEPTTPRPMTTFRPTTQAPRPRIIPTTPQPTPQPGLPEVCNVRLQATVRDFDGTLFAFVDGNYVIRITERGFLDRIRTRNLFRLAPWNMDAAYNIPSLGRTYFMKGQRIWEFDRMRNRMSTVLVQGGPRTMPERPRAVIATSASGNELEVFGSGIVWRMKMNGEVVSGTHRYIKDKYRGVPTEIDAAVRWDSNTIYFFKDSKFYRYNTRQQFLTRSGDFAPAFLKGVCGNAPK